MTSYIFVNGEWLPVTPAMINWARFQREKEAKRIDEQRRKSYDEFGGYLR
jgi:hypothetical protein